MMTMMWGDGGAAAAQSELVERTERAHLVSVEMLSVSETELKEQVAEALAPPPIPSPPRRHAIDIWTYPSSESSLTAIILLGLCQDQGSKQRDGLDTKAHLRNLYRYVPRVQHPSFISAKPNDDSFVGAVDSSPSFGAWDSATPPQQQSAAS